MVADAIKALGVEVDRRHIKLKGEAIKSVGTYEAEVAFHRDVVRTIPFRGGGRGPIATNTNMGEGAARPFSCPFGGAGIRLFVPLPP